MRWGFRSTCLISGPLLLFSYPVISNSLWLHGLQHARLLCPSLFPGVCWNSCPLNQWCHQPSHPLSPASPALNLSQNRGLFQGIGCCIRWQRYCRFSFNISPSNEYSGLLSFRVEWLNLLAVQGTVHQFLLLSLSCILPRLDLGSILLPPPSVLLSGTLTRILVIPVCLILWGWVKTQLCQEDFQVILLPCSLYYTC